MQDEHAFIWRAMLETIDIDLAGRRVLDAGCNRPSTDPPLVAVVPTAGALAVVAQASALSTGTTSTGSPTTPTPAGSGAYHRLRIVQRDTARPA